MIYVTCGSSGEARRIADAAVREGLAACANIIGDMRSVYRWEGEVREDRETVLILKTATDLVEALVERVRALHSYDVPCVVELPLDRGNPDYLAWIAAQVRGEAR